MDSHHVHNYKNFTRVTTNLESQGMSGKARMSCKVLGIVGRFFCDGQGKMTHHPCCLVHRMSLRVSSGLKCNHCSYWLYVHLSD